MTHDHGGTASVRIFTAIEKSQLAQQVFVDVPLDHVDFSAADLRGARFESVSLRGCDFTRADLRGVEFLRCDVRGACLVDVTLGANRFDGSRFADVSGLTESQNRYVRRLGGTFRRQVDGQNSDTEGDEA